MKSTFLRGTVAAIAVGSVMSFVRCASTGGSASPAESKPSKAAAPAAKVSAEVLARIDARMVAIPAGSAKAASRGGKPVAISAFRLGKYELTRGEWKAVMGGHPNPATDDLPATGVSFLDVRGFLDRLNEAAGADVYRLPTRIEWEYACHAGRAGKYPWGNDEKTIGAHAWWGKNSDEQAHPVGKKLPNAWGLFDMIGNVDEWTSDRMKEGLVYVEGGNFDELNASGLLCENESGVGEDARTDYNGFRLARKAKSTTR